MWSPSGRRLRNRVGAQRNGNAGISELVMAPPRTRALLLLLLLTLLGLGLVQPADGQDRMYQRFLRQHVDPEGKGGNDTYCNVMMQRRKMTTRQCKRFNTFVHEDIWNIRSICSTTNIQCKNGKMNCHEGVVKVTDCRETGSSRAPNCRYRASASTRHVVIACEGDPELPVHFDR
ncbi:ribonuclease 4 isoform X1 [Canis lupus baileyi]|nr:ribonuclease 4 isoform X6 [Canis lupus dingo]XP_035555317.1 ribonuclease 4 isoform X6 [Canis lupus dingo]XP_038543136.1 ribonuclease 4 isoform X2 [Canis lupus familiaris]XP_038543137.1 ribonuclease 4 isoform X2 [Canis lupus familiaris]